MGNPCIAPEKIPAEAPDVTCSKSGALSNATTSDGGHIIVGMLQELNSQQDRNDVSTVADACIKRAKEGYQSGMGKIFVEVAGINPLRTSNRSSENDSA